MPFECEECKRDCVTEELLEGSLCKCPHLARLCIQCLYAQDKRKPAISQCPMCERPLDKDEAAAIMDMGALFFNVDGLDPSVVQPLPADLELGVVTVSLMDGTAFTHQVSPQTLTRDIKLDLEKQTGTKVTLQRLMFNGAEIKGHTKGRPNNLWEAGVRPGHQLHLIAVYSAHAGQTSIRGEGIAMDRYGNAAGAAFDLGVSGAFEGLRIAVLQLYDFDFTNTWRALRSKGFEVQLWNYAPSPRELQAALRDCCQLWLISTQFRRLTEEHLQIIEEFWNEGNGVYIWGDNAPFYADANFVSAQLFRTTMYGNLPGQYTVGEARFRGGPGFTRHLIMTGVNHLYEGYTIATVKDSPNMIEIMRGSAGNLVLSAYDRGGRRGLMDGGFTRLYENWDTAGTARYVVNAAAWLANLDNRSDW